MRSLNLCDVPDVSKVAACGIVATIRLGWVGEIVLMHFPAREVQEDAKLQ